MKVKTTAAGLTIWLATSGAMAQSPGQVDQVYSPARYQALARPERQAYVAGAIDTDRFLDQQTKPMFAACLNGVTLARATDIVDQFLTTLPPESRSNMPMAVHNALLAACNRSGYTVQ